MKKIRHHIKTGLAIKGLFLFSSIMAYEIEHLEPPFWWVDMEVESLQLLVHGKNISFNTIHIFNNSNNYKSNICNFGSI